MVCLGLKPEAVGWKAQTNIYQVTVVNNTDILSL